MKQLTIDVGGTFTDCLVLDEAGDLYKFKAATTPDDPTRGVLDAATKAAAQFGQPLEAFLGGVARIVHGTTLGTNALITRRGVQVGLITTAGFRDELEMRRGIKNLHGSMFDQRVAPYEPLVPRYLRLGVTERIRFDGEVLTPLAADEVRAATRRLVQDGCEAIAIGFISSYVNPAHELQAKEIVRAEAPDLYVTTSYEILPVWREFERFSSTVVSAYIGPLIERYLTKLERELATRGFSGALLMMQANALVQTVDHCIDRAVYLLDSGPAAAPSGALSIGGRRGHENVLSVDMGGTSFDICAIRGATIPTTTNSWVGEDRVAIRMVDLVTIGAGGGSLASIDALGLLRVGPQSAGADPGPAAYGKGDGATVTDANLVLGYVPADYFLGGEMVLDLARAREAIDRIGGPLRMGAEEAALAIHTTANANMCNAINEMLTKRGHDVREFAMVAGGGSGGVHAAGIARRLGIPEVIVPRVAALLSAYGMYTMDLGLEFARSRFLNRARISAADLQEIFAEMRVEADEAFARLGIPEADRSYASTVEMRYAGQFTDVEVDLPPGEVTNESLDRLVEDFHRKFKQLFLYSMPWLGVEFLTFRLRVSAPRPHVELAPAETASAGVEAALVDTRRLLFDDGPREAPMYDWERLQAGHRIAGPAVIVDRTTSVLVPPDFESEVDEYGSIVLRPVTARANEATTAGTASAA
ncbi:MAG: hydantoinase/oxoprolinase family protein [Thermoleophilia bacterium]|nr:hydantoinase/oxoprolinase family protein [Thermoleophilia bacterium]